MQSGTQTLYQGWGKRRGISAMKTDIKLDCVLNRQTMRGCLGAIVVASAAAFTPSAAVAQSNNAITLDGITTATEALPREFWDPVFIGQTITGEDNFQMRVSAKSFFDYGGGYITGLQMHALDPALTGGGYHTGYLSSQIDPITFNGDLGVIKFFGQTNIGYIDVDNGNPLSDNSHFATMPNKYFGIAIGNLLDDSHDLRFGVNLTGEYALNRTDLKGDNRDDAGCDEDELDQEFCLYDANVYVASSRWGRITVGRGESASARVGAINTGGIAFATDNDPINKVGFHDVPMLGVAFADVALGDVNGMERIDGVRYDSPTFAGFTLSGSWGEDDEYDVALRYAGEFGGIRVAGGAAYQNFERDNTGATQQNVTVAASVYHTPTGLYIAGSGTAAERNADMVPAIGEKSSATAWYVQGGYRSMFTELGETVLFAEYGTQNDSASSGNYFMPDSGTEYFGLGIVQDVDMLGASLYVTYNNYSAERAGVQGDDIGVVMTGLRIKY